MKKIFIILLAILALVVLVLASNKQPGIESINTSSTTYIFETKGQSTGYGFVEVSFAQDFKEDMYLNATILESSLKVNPNPGNLSAEPQDYRVVVSEDIEILVPDRLASSLDPWIVKNMRVSPLEDNPLRFSFQLPDTFDKTKESIEISFSLTETKLSDSGDALEEETIVLTSTIETSVIDTEFGLDVEGASPDLKRGIGLIKTAHAQVSDHDFWADVERTTPDLSGGPMDCFAIATANNLISLAQEHDFDANFPAPAAIITELKRDMQWNDGIISRNFLTGKAAFVERYNLPVTTREIKRPNMDDLEEAFLNGDAVEISTTMIRSRSGHANTGHVLTGMGASADGDDQQIGVHDPATPEGFDALRVTQSGGDKPYLLVEYPMWDGVVFIDAIYVQTWNDEAEEQSDDPQASLSEDNDKEESDGDDTEYSEEEEEQETKEPTDTAEVSFLEKDDIEMAFDHVAPGQYSEVYVSVTALASENVTVNLVGPAVEKSVQTVTADKNGLAHFTFKIFEYGQYIANVNTESSPTSTLTSTINVN